MLNSGANKHPLSPRYVQNVSHCPGIGSWFLLCIYFFFFLAGDTIAQLTDVGSVAPSPPDGRVTVFSDRTGMVKAARLLLSSVTKVLVLADRIVIKQIITSRNKVSWSHGWIPLALRAPG